MTLYYQGNQTKQNLPIYLIVILFLFIPDISYAESSNRIHYVDDDNTTGPWDGSIEHPFRYIQDGIDAAQKMDTVIVYPGDYYENLKVSKQIRLYGKEKNNTIIYASESKEFLLLDSVHYTVIGNFTFSCGNNERLDIIKMKNCTHCTISDVNIQSESIQRSALIVNGSINTIERIHIKGRFIFSGIELFYTDQNLVINNTIESYGSGILLFRSHNNMILYNRILNNTNGIYLEEGNLNYICGNILRNNNRGLFSSYATRNMIEKNDFVNNNEQAKFTKLLKTGFLLPNIWKFNYWDDLKGLLIKPIPGIFYIPNRFVIGLFIPWVEFDICPVAEPFNNS